MIRLWTTGPRATGHGPREPYELKSATLWLVDYTEEEIERLAEFASDPANLKPAGTEAWENGQRMARAIADTFTDKDWITLLNRLSADRAARQIARRPAEDRQYLLDLLSPDRRAIVEEQLASAV